MQKEEAVNEKYAEGPNNSDTQLFDQLIEERGQGEKQTKSETLHHGECANDDIKKKEDTAEKLDKDLNTTTTNDAHQVQSRQRTYKEVAMSNAQYMRPNPLTKFTPTGTKRTLRRPSL